MRFKRNNKSSLKGLSLASILDGKEEISKDRKLIINYSRMPNFISYPIPHGQTILKKDGQLFYGKVGGCGVTRAL